jgi:pSer/pThr/pTyr-binding forkhead associated (FHA) protein
LKQHVAPHADDADAPVLVGADGSTHRLPPMSTTQIGRGSENDVVLTDRKVSRRHAAIIDTGSTFVIADLRSGNGVYVQGRRIYTSAPLSSGDVIQIGDYTFAFNANAQESAGEGTANSISKPNI